MKKITAFNQRYRRSLAQLIIVAALAALQPWLWQQIEARTLAIHNQRSAREQLATLQARVVQIKQTTNAQQDLLDQLDVVVPPKESLPQVVERLERIAVEQQTQLDILDISEVPRLPDEISVVPITPVRVAVQVRGNAGQLLQVLDQIEHIQEIAIIEQWSLNPAPVTVVPSPVPGPVTYQLIANVVFFLQTPDNAQQ